ncbi:hypothetical protein RRG08_016035 [Elysia crispata]|uniref:Uncharacterized protein n=1 Tax=Elysia crispata TaxID=231223 RepID=A0AAE0Y0X0_9GAST|nr:hypothetical protein RRG08_016035 [Elysia crispata]
MSQLTSPFRTLIKKNAQWMGEHEQDRSRKIINETLSRASVLNLYDLKGKPQSSVMPLQDDWSRSLARQPACGICIKIAQQTEKNYTQIQEEMLQLFSQRNTSVSIFMDKMCRSSAIVSCFRLLRYNLEVMSQPGSQMYVADFLRRAVPINVKEGNKVEESTEETPRVLSATASAPHYDMTDRVRR